MRLFEFFIGFRYLKAKKSQGFISFNTLLSIIVVFLGVFILIVVMSVMSGFQSQIKDKILDVDAHISISDMLGDDSGYGIKDYQGILGSLKDNKDIRAIYPFVQGQGLFRFRSHISFVMIRGMGKVGQVPPDVKKFIIEGDKNFAQDGIYIGQEMALLYSINIGDKVELIVPKGRLTAAEGVSPGLGAFKVLGIFKTGYYDFDTKLIIMSLPQAQKLYELGDVASGIGIKLKDVWKMDQASQEIQNTLGFRYVTQTAKEKNQNLFYALKLEKLIMTVILFLVIVSAGFTIMGTLVMVVMEKRKAIGILKSMGAKPQSIMIIFVLEGFIIGMIGSLLGVIFGVAASLNLEAIITWVENVINAVMGKAYGLFNMGPFYKVVLIPKNVYYIENFPTEVNPEFVVFIAIFAVFLSTVAAIFPSWSASRLQPVETIRYE